MNKITLQHLDDFKTLGILNLKTRRLTKDYKTQQSSNSYEDINGFFTDYGQIVIGFFSLNKIMNLFVDQKWIEIDKGYSITVSGAPDARLLKVFDKNSNTIFEVTYALSSGNSSFEEDFTGFIEDEDFDIGLLAKNIANDEEGKRAFINQ